MHVEFNNITVWRPCPRDTENHFVITIFLLFFAAKNNFLFQYAQPEFTLAVASFGEQLQNTC